MRTILRLSAAALLAAALAGCGGQFGGMDMMGGGPYPGGGFDSPFGGLGYAGMPENVVGPGFFGGPAFGGPFFGGGMVGFGGDGDGDGD